jgi:c-di-GMP-binding flagellar brake protein YcgR
MTSTTADSGIDPADTPPAASELLPVDEFGQYLLHAKGEMFSVLRRLVDQVAQITLFFNEGRDLLLTSLIRYGENGLDLDFGASSEMNRKALEADRLFCATQLDKVKIQFILNGLRRTEIDGHPAFHAALPESILRLQRREHYRLATSLTRPLKCRIRFSSVDGAAHPLEAPVADISGGGVCLVGLPVSLPLEIDMEIPGCSIDLPEVGSITTTLRLRSISESANRMGVRSQRVGCAFVDLPGPMANLIQRYIIKIERERKARESGLA